MNTIAVDDKRLAVNAVQRLMNTIDPTGIHNGYTNAEAALEAAQTSVIDIAFLDIEMPGINGLELAKSLKDIHAHMNIVFVTGYPEYALEAFGVYASGFLCKPIDEMDIRSALDNLRHPIECPHSKRVYFQCFGNFEVFVDGRPIHFQRSRTKEMLAYLIDRQGTGCTMGELLAVLWEDRPDSSSQRSQLRSLIADLRMTLKKYGIDDIILKRRNLLSVISERIDCDYYRFLQGDVNAVNLYHGEYMSQYSWSEMNISNIIQR